MSDISNWKLIGGHVGLDLLSDLRISFVHEFSAVDPIDIFPKVCEMSKRGARTWGGGGACTGGGGWLGQGDFGQEGADMGGGRPH